MTQYSENLQVLSQYTMPDASSLNPPLDFYLDAITRLETRLEKCAEDISEVSK